MVPSRIRSVDTAIAASSVHGSATTFPFDAKRWSHRKNASQPAASASRASPIVTAGSAKSPKFGTLSA